MLSVLYPQAAVFEPAGASGIVLARRDPRVGGSLLLRTDDGSQHWHALLDYPAPYILGAVPGLPDVQLGGLAVELPALQRLFVGLSKDGRGVLGSEDGGMTWGSVGARDIGAVSALVYNPEADILYAGTGSGLWRMTSPHPR